MSAAKPTAKGVGVYIFNADRSRILLTQRGPKARHEHFRWEGPGGKLEPDETYEQAAHRELMEELGITIQLGDEIGSFDMITDSNGHVWEAKIFEASTTDTPRLIEPDKCVGFGWFTKQEVRRLNLADYVVQDLQQFDWL